MSYAYVTTGANSANSNTISFTPTNANDLLVLVSSTSSGAGTPTITSVVDNNGVSWAVGVATFQGASSGSWYSVYYLLNNEAGITAVTVTYAGGTPGTCNISITEYSGVGTATSAFLGAAKAFQASPGTGTDALSSPTLNVGAVPALILGISIDYNEASIAAGTGFTSRFNSTVGGSVVMVEDLLASVLGNQKATATASTGTDIFATFVLAFALPTASAGPSVYTRVSHGAYATGFNTAITPAMPAGWAVGNLLILFAGDDGAGNTQTVAGGGTGGYTLLSPNSLSTDCNIWGRIAQAGDTSPSITSSTACNQFGMLVAYTGNPPSITGIVNVSGDRQNTSPQQILCELLTQITPTVNGCLFLAGGRRIKTSAGDGETVNTLTNFSIIASSIPTGANAAAVLNEWIQTAPAPAGTTNAQSCSIPDVSSIVMGTYLALVPNQPTLPGFQYAICTTTSFSGYSLQQGSSPAVAVGDYFVVSLTTQPNNFGIVVNGDGTVDINASGNTSRQSFQYYILRSATNVLDGPATVWVNEKPPVWAQAINLTIPAGGAPSVNLATSAYASSPSGDVLTFALASGALPPGGSVTNAGILNPGPGTTPGTYTGTIAATDITGTATASAFTIVVQSGAPTGTVPNIVGLASATAQADILAAGFPIGAVNQGTSTTAQIGFVLSQSPTAQAGVLLTQPVSFVVGAGPVTPNAPVLELPSLIGLTQAQAQATLAAVGAAVGTSTSTYDPV